MDKEPFLAETKPSADVDPNPNLNPNLAPQPKPDGKYVATKISQEEFDERMMRLESMGKSIGDDFGMEVGLRKTPGPPRYIFKPVNRIEMPPNEVEEKGVEYCFGVIAHEGAHRKVSRLDFIADNVLKAPGFMFLMNAIEDPRVNNWVAESYDGAKGWLQDMYDEDFPPEQKIEQVAKGQLGYVPKHTRFGLEVINRWHNKAYSKGLHEDVQNALDKTHNYAEAAYNMLPASHNPTEDDIDKNAKGMYQFVYGGVYPEYKKLVEQSVDDEKTRQQIKDMIENGEINLDPNGGDGGDGGGGEPLPLDDLPEDLREKLKQKIKEKLESMTPEERAKYEAEMKKRAKEALGDLDDKVNGDLAGKFTEQPESENQKAKREANEKGSDQVKASLEDIKKEIEKKLEQNRSDYDKAYLEVQPYIEKVSEDIINLFASKRWPQYRAGFPGQRLRLKGAMDWQANNNYKTLFETRERIEKKQFAFLFLIDLSGSMGGDKINESFKAAVLFAEALNRIASVMGDVAVGIYGFQDELLEYKKFEDGFDDDQRKKMSVMKQEVAGKGVHNKNGHNNDGFCLDGASKILDQLDATDKFLIVASDGQPASDGNPKHYLPGFGKDNDAEELRYAINKISEGGKQKLLAVGLGSDATHVQDYYANTIPNVDNLVLKKVKQFAETLVGKLEQMLTE